MTNDMVKGWLRTTKAHKSSRRSRIAGLSRQIISDSATTAHLLGGRKQVEFGHPSTSCAWGPRWSPEPRRHHCHVLDFTQLKTEESRHETLTVGRGLLDALDLAPVTDQPTCRWVDVRPGESSEGLRVDRPVRMSHGDVGVWL